MDPDERAPREGELGAQRRAITATTVVAILSFLVIAAAWVFYRPVIGITMIVLAIAALYWLVSVGRKKKAVRAGMVTAPVSV